MELKGTKLLLPTEEPTVHEFPLLLIDVKMRLVFQSLNP